MSRVAAAIPKRSPPLASYHDRALWLADRPTYLGGSEAPAVVGRNPNQSRQQVWARKVSPPTKDEPNGDMRRGNKQEDLAAAKYVEKTGRRIRRCPMRRHKLYPELGCNVDRQIIGAHGGPGKGPGLLELKVPRVAKFYEVRDSGLPEDWIIQLQHNMAVMDYTWSAFGVYTPEYDDMVQFDVLRDDEYCEWLVRQGRDFMNNYVFTKRPPPQAAPPPMPELRQAPGVATVHEDVDWRLAAFRLVNATEQLVVATAEHAEAEAGIVDLVPEAWATPDNGGPPVNAEVPFHHSGHRAIAKRYLKKGRTTLDHKSLAAYGPIDPLKLGVELHKLHNILQGGGAKAKACSILAEMMAGSLPLGIDFSEFEKQAAPSVTTKVTALVPHDDQPAEE